MFCAAKRTLITGSRSAVAIAAFAGALVAAPAGQAAETPSANSSRLQAAKVQKIGGELYTFYAGRNYRPLWWDGQGKAVPAMDALMVLLQSSAMDGIASGTLDMAGLGEAIRSAKADPSPDRLTRADLLLSNTFVAYVQALRTDAGKAMIYEHNNLRPREIGAYNLLTEAATSVSLEAYVRQMKWMHPLYAPLRFALITDPSNDQTRRQAVMASLARLRGVANARRHILVDVATARLWMYENGQAVDTMRVVVGKAATRTPLLAGYVRYAITNPYWNVPPDLVSANIAPNVLGRGPAYLKTGGYQVLSDWSAQATVVDPRTIDWRAAQRGELDLRVRQLPHASNFMGKVKFEFPNPYGIYLHDTPQKSLMQRDARQLSNGCIRLEDARRLGRWLMQGDLPESTVGAENKVDLPKPVPIYITYLSAHLDAGSVALGPDPYALDTRAALASGAAHGEMSRR